MLNLFQRIRKQASDWAIWSLALVVSAFVGILLINQSRRVSPSGGSSEFYVARGKILVVVVVRGGAQIGDKLFTIENALQEISKRIEQGGIRNYCVLATDDARWGDVVAIYGAGRIPNATSRQLSSLAIKKIATFPEIVKITNQQKIFCGFSLGLDTFVVLDYYDRNHSEAE